MKIWLYVMLAVGYPICFAAIYIGFRSLRKDWKAFREKLGGKRGAEPPC